MGSIYDETDDSFKDSDAINNEKAKGLTFLNSFGTNLTQLAIEGKLDPVIGRDEEVKRMMQILCRRKKNNPVLVGEGGVGKTSIVDHLAIKIAEGSVPLSLQGKEIYTLEMSTIVAGTKYRGQFEERMKSLISELKANPHIIIFIDELHTIIAAGSTGGSLDASNIIKPALARGEFNCIGATTYDEYRNNIESDGAFSRRFQQVTVNEPSLADTITIITNIKEKYEQFHSVKYEESILELIVNVADRHISNRFFPDKAIDIMDEVGSYKKLIGAEVPNNIKKLEEDLKANILKKKEFVNKQNYENAAKQRDVCESIKNKIELAKKEWNKKLSLSTIPISEDDVLNVISKMSGVPLEKLSDKENKALLKMEDELKKSVIGQDHVIEKISSVIRRNRIGIRKRNRTIGNFIFLGSTGIGKTFLTKKINSYLFGSENSLIRIDMGEFMDRHSTSKLIGSPPGYIGYDKGGHLTEQVRRNPHSVILFDEIEKAHPDVFNIMLHLLDDGYLTDSSGRHIDFSNTLIIMTSNIGSRQLEEFGTGIGFNQKKVSDQVNEESKILNKALQQKFSPEFLNRIDEIIIFNKLSEDSIMAILNKELNDLKVNLNEIGGYSLKVSSSAKKIIIKQGFDKKYGARQLNRTIEKLLESPISDKILKGEIQKGDTITVKSNNGKLKIL
jgi:ATP-dependent Clp protease ATP-binding subunit ClpC